MFVIQLPPSKNQPKRVRFICGFKNHVGFAGHISRARQFQSKNDALNFMYEQHRKDTGYKIVEVV